MDDRPTGFYAPNSSRPLLIVIEGANDWDFLVRLASRIRIDSPTIPDLAVYQNQGRIVPILLGGGNPTDWPYRVAFLGYREFHLYDREQDCESEPRQAAIDIVNARDGCFGVLTRKRSLENYLHPQAIQESLGIAIQYDDQAPVARLLAEQMVGGSAVWREVSFRKQRRMIAKVKRRLNTHTVNAMTLELLSESDPAGEILGWLSTIAKLLQ